MFWPPPKNPRVPVPAAISLFVRPGHNIDVVCTSEGIGRQVTAVVNPPDIGTVIVGVVSPVAAFQTS